MPALCSILFSASYAKNYAGIFDADLMCTRALGKLFACVLPTCIKLPLSYTLWYIYVEADVKSIIIILTAHVLLAASGSFLVDFAEHFFVR